MSVEISSMCQIREAQEYKQYNVKSELSLALGVDLINFDLEIPCVNPTYNEIDRISCSRLNWTPLNDRVLVRWAKLERRVPVETTYTDSPLLQKVAGELPSIAFCKEVFSIDGFMVAGPDNFLTKADHYLSCSSEMDANGNMATVNHTLKDLESGVPRAAYDGVFSALLTFFKNDCPFLSQYL